MKRSRMEEDDDGNRMTLWIWTGHGQQKNIDEYGLSGHCLLQYIAYRVPV